MPLHNFFTNADDLITEEDYATMDVLVRHLEEHSAKSAIKSRGLERATGHDAPKVRAMVGYLRRHGVPISSDHHGYRIETPPEGLDATIAHMASRITAMREVVSGLVRSRAALRSPRSSEAPFALDYTE